MTDLNLTKVNVTDLDYVYTMYSILDFLAQKHYQLFGFKIFDVSSRYLLFTSVTPLDTWIA